MRGCVVQEISICIFFFQNELLLLKIIITGLLLRQCMFLCDCVAPCMTEISVYISICTNISIEYEYVYANWTALSPKDCEPAPLRICKYCLCIYILIKYCVVRMTEFANDKIMTKCRFDAILTPNNQSNESSYQPYYFISNNGSVLLG